jgi:acyl-CoA oxidase
MDAEAAEFLSSGFLRPEQHQVVRNRFQELLAELRPDVVGLVDAWGLPDYLLNSSLGNYDGSSSFSSSLLFFLYLPFLPSSTSHR